eukprot:3440083-Prymnesium_polylepis.1
MPHKASSTRKDGPVRWGINWDGRALPVLADGRARRCLRMRRWAASSLCSLLCLLQQEIRRTKQQ